MGRWYVTHIFATGFRLDLEIVDWCQVTEIPGDLDVDVAGLGESGVGESGKHRPI